MALPKPNQLRYTQCEIPFNVEAALNAFVDEFHVNMSVIDAELDAFKATEVPAILTAEQDLAKQIQELLAGAPITDLASLQALQDNLYLINPLLDENDPAVVSLDERKLGAAGMVLVNGKIFAKASGDDMEAFRQVWFAVGGNYQSFLVLGDGIANSSVGDFTLLQYIADSGIFPYVNRPWTELDKLRPNVKISKYTQPLIWTEGIGTDTSTYNKLKTIGYSDVNISRIMARKQPQDDTDTLTGILQNSVAQMKFLSGLFALQYTDPRRNPKWLNEVKYMKQALQSYLQYRTEVNLTSLIFHVDLWERVKASLNENDLKEIFENRPEVTNMVVPTDANGIGQLLNSASNLQVGSSAINSYMLKLPKPKSNADYEERLISVGARILSGLLYDKNPASGTIQSLLNEVKGGVVGKGDIKSPPKMSVNDMQNLLGNPSGAVGNTVNTVNSGVKNSPDPEATQDAIGASTAGDAALTVQQQPTQGLPTTENFMTILFRRIKWDHNFVSCSKQTAKSSNAPTGSEINNKFTQFGPAINQNISGGAGSSPSPEKLYGTSGTELLKNPKNLGSTKGENLDNLPNKGSDRRQVLVNQGNNGGTKISSQFTYNCTPTFSNGFTQEIENLIGKVSNEIVIVCEALKRALFLVQNIIDSLIAKAQVVLDQVLGVLERLLTLDLNLGGSLGFDNSLIKCSWNLDFGIKIDLFGALLTLLNELFSKFGDKIHKGLRLIQDIINKAICIPIRLLEMFLGGVNSLLNLIGCSLKDIKLPQAILDLLKALLFTFDLRSLVLRQGYEAFNGMTANFSKNKDAFNGLTQFAAICQNVTMRDAIDSIESATLAAGIGAPALLANKIIDQADFLAQESLAASVGVII